jgi:hypothetical protein
MKGVLDREVCPQPLRAQAGFKTIRIPSVFHAISYLITAEQFKQRQKPHGPLEKHTILWDLSQEYITFCPSVDSSPSFTRPRLGSPRSHREIEADRLGGASGARKEHESGKQKRRGCEAGLFLTAGNRAAGRFERGQLRERLGGTLQASAVKTYAAAQPEGLSAGGLYQCLPRRRPVKNASPPRSPKAIAEGSGTSEIIIALQAWSMSQP